MAALSFLSRMVLGVEKALLIALAAAITLLILLNVVTRAVNYAIFWVDELTIYAMIWMVMIGASVCVRERRHIAVTLLIDAVPERVQRPMLIAIDVVVAAFALTLIWTSFIWYDPMGVIAAGFDLDAFAGASFNYIYAEPTNTIGIAKVWVWAVMPLVALTITLHACANLAERLAGVEEPRAQEAAP
ncbi:MAG: TRAP transporter small permease [Pseudomonadota bacterium]